MMMMMGNGNNNNGAAAAAAAPIVVGNKKNKKKSSGGGGGSLSFRSNKAVDLTGSAKLTALMELLDQWKPEGHKALVFCQTRMMLDIIENAVSQKQYRYIRMDGTTAGAGRHDLVHQFNHDNSIFVALLTTRVGGLGLNLTGANRVVLFDPDWNPTIDEQARERAWRIGQTREVHVYRLISSGTIEEHILHRQMAKMFVTEKVLSDPTLQRFFSIHSLADSFRLGSEYTERVADVCHGTIVSTTISIRPSIKNELKKSGQDAGSDLVLKEDTANTNTNNNIKKKSGKESLSTSRIVADEHARQAPQRSELSENSNNNGFSQSMMMARSQTYEFPSQHNNNNNNNNSTSSGGSGDTGVISALVDGTNDGDGVVQRANNSSLAAKRLAQLSALATLKKALTNNNGKK